ncbi:MULTISPECIES: M48 family metallopeptidase [Vibrio]|uniref:M48 family metallopeptidase n=1 Tax=Vibrio TaxID=662 RepID=UPI0020758C3E|nr:MULTISPECIES: M48 family metallopeptidase [Vibrio]USD32216.1 M48 family metallopeptidase [Vibrio sp. SCSIO 43186]USD45259.1 M48 family metallopeptidase [Vibrio sp. SCSIO 43145]USD69342.1 M48 family metallopeptidase [Vibrio sp. SCSIO 43139]USD97029.1 Zn-dependent protease [Vibrio coralliilyticus]
MMFDGVAFPPRSSERHPAKLDVTQANALSLRVEGQIISCDQQYAEISVPVGNLPVRFKFPDGWVFVVERTTEVSHWLERNRRSSAIDKMEANWFAWLLSAVVCIGVVLGSYFYVLPWTSDKVANAIPDYVAVALGDKVLESFDNSWQESELSQQEQQAIRQRVAQHVTQLEALPYPIEVVFRSSELGANAFALPGGKIVLLDDLVTLAENEQQLDSIILHELGHVHHRHMMKRLVHSSLLSVGVALLTGESSGVVDNLAGVGVFFLSNGHSREAEIEADVYAIQAMQAIYGSSAPMAEMFELFRQQGELEIPEWMSTHPDFKQRIDAARQ